MTVPSPPRIALFGLLGSGNIGNDGSFEAVLAHLREHHPDAELTCVCTGPDVVEKRYGVRAIPMHTHPPGAVHRSRVTAAVLKSLGKAADAFRTLRWVRRHDVVLVPGMGVLETNLPQRPWGFPYALLLVTATGRLMGTKVALVSVGVSPTRQPVTKRVLATAARFATARSYRDILSRDALREMGVDTSGDTVCPDLAFALPVPRVRTPAPTRTVGLGVMAYHGNHADRHVADDIHRAYVGALQRFAERLVDDGYRLRLFTGDPADESVSAAVVAYLRERRPDLDDDRVVATPPSSLGELMEAMSDVDVVVASRYHNVLCALKLGKPTISISYAEKNDVLMAQFGLGDYCQPLRDLDLDRLTAQFTSLVDRREELARGMRRQSVTNARLVGEHLAALSTRLFAGTSTSARPSAGSRPRAG
ncbi:MAG: hypothetical protein GEV10_14205 [Streptosporangiales bacterium]|nr:hypothetical protein [Streptosporangiales bacterium]